jgi:hypothetical protein
MDEIIQDQDEILETDVEENIKDPHLLQQWQEYITTEDYLKPPKVDENILITRIKTELGNVSTMSVEEYTLYQKWCEVHEKYPVVGTNNLFGRAYVAPEQEKIIKHVKSNIWTPSTPDDFLTLEPELIYTDKPIGEQKLPAPELWNAIRTFSSTMKNNNNIGRNLNFIVRDKVTKKYLGVICISSDFLDLTPRDKYIGWSREIKTQGHMINHTAIGSTIVPLQPLGFNYVGGKLLALLCLSDEIQEQWKKQYKDILVAVTTTSLYGSFSQYQNLQYWKKRGHSSGSVSYEPTKETIYMIRDWLKEKYPRKYFEWYYATKESGQPYKRDHRNRSLTFVYSKLGIPKELIKSKHERGIYFSTLYENTNTFLRKEIQEKDLVKAFDTSTNALVSIWKEKYAKKRIDSLIRDNRTNFSSLFYDDLIYMDWKQTKEKYLEQVGR